MLKRSDIEEIKKISEEFFRKTTFDVKIEILEQRDLTLPINLKVENPKILIGEKGQTLIEIQHLLRSILKRKIKGDFFIDLDINGYKKKKAEYLKELARNLADEVALTGKEKELPSMPAYERRIIHLELADRPNVLTESVGKEPQRRVVIKPYP